MLSFFLRLQGKSSRKRRRKTGGPFVQPKKKRVIVKANAGGGEVASQEKKTTEVAANAVTTEDGLVGEPRPQMGEEKADAEGDSQNIRVEVQDNDNVKEVDAAAGDGPRPEITQSQGFAGAKRRKSGSVRRFIQTMNESSDNDVLASNVIARSTDRREVNNGVETDETERRDAVDKSKKFDGSVELPSIVKILKTVSLLASVTNNVQDSVVKFIALR